MHVTWHGLFTIKIQTGDITLILDPYSPDTGLSPFRSRADIVSLSNPSEPSMSHLDGITGDPFIIDTPGEYSVKNIGLHSISWRPENTPERSVQRFMIEKLTLLHLGALSRPLSNGELQEIEKTDIDVLFLPVGGGASLGLDEAMKFLTVIEPRIVIPINFALPKLKQKLTSLEAFAKEVGVDPKKSEKKTIIKPTRLPQEEMQTIILSP